MISALEFLSVWKLIACTICEITRNSMYHSGFPVLPRLDVTSSQVLVTDQDFGDINFRMRLSVPGRFLIRGLMVLRFGIHQSRKLKGIPKDCERSKERPLPMDQLPEHHAKDMEMDFRSSSEGEAISWISWFCDLNLNKSWLHDTWFLDDLKWKSMLD
ncbi:hypothetical protein MKW98_003628 [Papaver atlanticum]|uniref:Uncharacterized protein n=1 Tax=Papaver atlanticum TaxID=357466 RepID=A0AAD4SJQ9_9MAGN|nr:hypothetical protein MKW98_003628 [Papaver atlanticum]